MTRIGVRELRQNASVYLAQVKAGQVVEITERGTLIAVMRAPSPQAATREALIAAGRLLPARHAFDLPDQRITVTGDTSASQVLDASRGERLR